MVGKTILHYKIIEEIGRGGMGVVYKAQDTKLDRFVALKFLPLHLGIDEEEQQRFVQEAKAASALDHPNICTIFEIGKTDEGQMYMAMAYYEGETLKQKIDRGPLSIEEALDIASQIAAGLARAHEKDIVHRDIKPANIIITRDHRVKILDFGLAKLGGQSKLTRAGTTLGTTAYMSPEQSQAQKVDRRTDIFSLGVVLYEMITGELPFKGDYEQATIYAILNETQQPVTGLRSGVPIELERIINKCLQKNPDARYQRLDEMIVDLKQHRKDSERKEILSQSGMKPVQLQPKRMPLFYAGIALVVLLATMGYILWTPGEKTHSSARIPIAVADFTNQTGEAELDGLSGMLITALEQSRRLSVLSRARMFDILEQMGKAHVDRIDEATGREISRQAGINVLVTASIRKLGKKYIIDMKVMDPRKNEYLLTAREDGEGQESVLAMIDRLSEKTRKGLNEQAEEIQRNVKKVSEVTTTNLQAYQHFFRGEQLISKLKWGDAVIELKKAISMDSTFGLAYYRLSYALSWNGSPGAAQAIDQALKYIDRVPEKEQHMIRAEKAEIERDMPKALALHKEGLRKYPNEKEMMYIVGDLYFHLAEYDSAIYYLKKVLAIDPLFERAWQHLNWTYRETHSSQRVEAARQYVEHIPSEGAYLNLASAYETSGDLDMGIQTYEKTLNLFPESNGALIGIAGNHIMRGELKDAGIQLHKMISKDRPEAARSGGYGALAVLSAYQGKFKEAFQFLDKQIQVNEKGNKRSILAHIYAIKAYWLAVSLMDYKGAREVILSINDYQDAASMNAYAAIFYASALSGKFDGIFLKASQQSDLFPFRELVTEGFKYKSAGKYPEAADAFQKVMEKGMIFDQLIGGYYLAESAYEMQQYDRALAALKKIKPIPFPLGFDVFYFGTQSAFYPKTLYLLGKIYQKKGNTRLAMKNYREFLKLWKDADPDLPELIDARAEMVKLNKKDV